MGVYCFRWKRGPWVKVGHYKGGNPWSRIAHRGWRSVVCPDIAIPMASPDDFELLFWSAELGRAHERAVHARFDRWRFGEWIPAHHQARVLEALAGFGPDNAATSCGPAAAAAAAATRRRL